MTASRDLTAEERRIAEEVIKRGARRKDDYPTPEQIAIALSQLTGATYARLRHPGTDVCFEFEVADSVSLLEPSSDVWMLWFQSPDASVTGAAELWVLDGLIDAIELWAVGPAGDEASRWPPLDWFRKAPDGSGS